MVAQSLERDSLRALAPGCGIVLALSVLACRPTEELVPPAPPFAKQNEASVARFREADRRARENPRSAEAVGRLGMLYHAYGFLDEARRCYETARRLRPDDFRFVYYGAKVEKSAFRYEASEALWLRALAARPDEAELWAELGDLYLSWNRRGPAEKHLVKALELDPREPLAALGTARLLVHDQKWREAIDLLTPLLDWHPRLSRAHQYLAAAYGALGMERERSFHQQAGEYGSAAESPLMREVDELALDAILDGDPAEGPKILRAKCARCHDHERIYERDEDRRWWARTVRRMQREAGWDWLSDEEAAAVVAYLNLR